MTLPAPSNPERRDAPERAIECPPFFVDPERGDIPPGTPIPPKPASKQDALNPKKQPNHEHRGVVSWASRGLAPPDGVGDMARGDRPERIELLPGADPEKVQAALNPLPELDPEDPDAVWLLGDDPEADARATRDRRNQIRRQVFSSGFQFVIGIVVGLIALATLIKAVVDPRWQTIVPAAIMVPVGFWFFRVRWRRWLGSAPYCYRLLTSLGEDAENVLVEHRRKQRAKFVKKVGTLYGDSYGEHIDEDPLPDFHDPDL